MEIGLITMHKIVNYGSVLQSYATLFTFNRLGHNTTIIDYYNERMHLLGMAKRIKNKKEVFKKHPAVRFAAQCVMLPSYIHRFHTFKKFWKKYYNLTDTTYSSFEELCKAPPIFDIYCTGSDQVWNSGWNEFIDRAFFLDFIPKDKKCFAYAASFGKSALDENEKTETTELLKKYGALSVRESSGVNILNELGFKDAVNVLDPTLLLNLNDWKPMISNRFKNKKYIMVYNLNRNPEIDRLAQKLSQSKNLPIYSICYAYHDKIKRKGKVYCCPDVEDFLSMIFNAEYVITDSFHCTAFSINFGKKFITVYPQKFNTRLQSIIELCGLESRVAASSAAYTAADEGIDYDKVYKRLELERKRAIEFINKSINN